MIPALLLAAVFTIALTPTEFSLLQKLGTKSFRERERADRALRERFNWWLAIRLESREIDNCEARRRVARMQADFWRGVVPDAEQAPYIDAANGPACIGPWKSWNRVYYARADRVPSLWPRARWGQFRYATVLWVEDLAAARVPPILIRAWLAPMDRESAEWDKKNPGREQAPMPRPF